MIKSPYRYPFLTILFTIISQCIATQYHFSQSFQISDSFGDYEIIDFAILRNNTLAIHIKNETLEKVDKFYFYKGIEFQREYQKVDISSNSQIMVRYTDLGLISLSNNGKTLNRFGYPGIVIMKIGRNIISNIITFGQQVMYIVQAKNNQLPALLIFNLLTYNFQFISQFMKVQSLQYAGQAYIAKLSNNMVAIGYEYNLYIYNIATRKCQKIFNTRLYEYQGRNNTIIGLQQFHNTSKSFSIIRIQLQNNIQQIYLLNTKTKTYSYYNRIFNPTTKIFYQSLTKGVSLMDNLVLEWWDFNSNIIKLSYEQQSILKNVSVLAVQDQEYLKNSWMIALFNKQNGVINLYQIQQSYQMSIRGTINLNTQLTNCLHTGYFYINTTGQLRFFMEFVNCGENQYSKICYIVFYQNIFRCINKAGSNKQQIITNDKNVNNNQQIQQKLYLNNQCYGFQLIDNKFLTICNLTNLNQKYKNGVYSYQVQLHAINSSHTLLKSLQFSMSQPAYNFRILYNKQWGLTFVVLAQLHNNSKMNQQCLAMLFKIQNQTIIKVPNINKDLQFWKSVAVNTYIASMYFNNTIYYLKIYQNNFNQVSSFQKIYSSTKYKLIAQGQYLILIIQIKNFKVFSTTIFHLKQSWTMMTLYREYFEDIQDLLDMPNYFFMPSLDIFYIFNPGQKTITKPIKVIYNIRKFPVTVLKKLQTQQNVTKKTPITYLPAQNNYQNSQIIFKGYQYIVLLNYSNHQINQNNSNDQSINNIFQESIYNTDTSKNPINKMLSDIQSRYIMYPFLYTYPREQFQCFIFQIIQGKLTAIFAQIISINTSHPYFGFDINSNSQVIYSNGSQITIRQLDYQKNANQYGQNIFNGLQATRSGCTVIIGQYINQKSHLYVNIYSINKTKAIQFYFDDVVLIGKLSQDCQLLAIYIQYEISPYSKIQIFNVTTTNQIATFYNIISDLTKPIQIFFTSIAKSSSHSDQNQNINNIHINAQYLKNQINYISIQQQNIVKTCPIYGSTINCVSKQLPLFSNIAHNKDGNIIGIYRQNQSEVSIFEIKEQHLRMDLIGKYNINNKYNVLMEFGSDDKLYVLNSARKMYIFDTSPCPATYFPINLICQCKQNYTQIRNKCICKQNYTQSNKQCICKQNYTFYQYNSSCLCSYPFYKNQAGQCICDGYIDYQQQNQICFECNIFCGSCSGSGIKGCNNYNQKFYIMLVSIIVFFLLTIAVVLFCCLKKRRRITKQLQQKFRQNGQSNITQIRQNRPRYQQIQKQRNQDQYKPPLVNQDQLLAQIKRDSVIQNKSIKQISYINPYANEDRTFDLDEDDAIANLKKDEEKCLKVKYNQ